MTNTTDVSSDGRRARRASEQQESQKIHFTAIDGVRGAAIISVLLYHSGWSTRGLFGVDAFFVISGFLISFLIMKELRSTGRFRVGRFYARRGLRLIPGLILTLAAVLILLWRLGTLDELRAASETALFSLLQVANWQQIATGGSYWEQSGAIVPLGQMWSLSVTEQVYLVWPFLLLALWWVARKRLAIFTALITLFLVASALVAPLLFDGTTTDRLYLGTDSRVVSFIAGAAAAAAVTMLLQHPPRWAGESPSARARALLTVVSLVSLAGTVALSVSTTSYHEPWLYQGGLVLVSILVATFTATLCFRGNALRRPFSLKFLTITGTLSYTLFLVHLPVYWFVDHWGGSTLHPLALFLIGGVASWFTALIVHYVITDPIRALRWTPRGGIIGLIISFAIVGAMAWYLPIQRINTPNAETFSAQTDVTHAFAVTDPTPWPETLGHKPSVAVIGDSVAGNMYDGLAEYGSGRMTPINVTKGGCGIFDADSAKADNGYVMDTKGLCWDWKDKLRTANAEQHPDVYVLRNLWDADPQLFNGSWIQPCDTAWEERYRTQLELLISIAAEQQITTRILLTNDVPREESPYLNSQRLACKSAVEKSVAEAHANVDILDIVSAACPGGTCQTTTADGQPLYRDGVHFSDDGLKDLAPWLEDRIARALYSQ